MKNGALSFLTATAIGFTAAFQLASFQAAQSGSYLPVAGFGLEQLQFLQLLAQGSPDLASQCDLARIA